MNDFFTDAAIGSADPNTDIAGFFTNEAIGYDENLSNGEMDLLSATQAELHGRGGTWKITSGTLKLWHHAMIRCNLNTVVV